MNLGQNKSKLLAMLLSVFLLTSCGSTAAQNQSNAQNQPSIGQQTASVSTASGSSSTQQAIIITADMITYDTNDSYTDWKNDNPNYIELNGSSATIKGTGASSDGSTVTISEAGVYVLSGKSDNGQITVDVDKKGFVKLVLNGVEIKNNNGSPIYVKNAGKAIISLPEGTANTVIDGSAMPQSGTNSNTDSDEPTAAIFSKDNVTINGSGKLFVQTTSKDGITSHDNLKITGGTLDIASADDGLIGKDMVLVKDGNVSIEATGDGIKTTNDSDTSKGFIAIEGGTFKINAGADGIQSQVSTLITGGDFNITTGGGSKNAPIKVENMRDPMGRPNNNATAPTATPTTTTEDESDSKKAIKAVSDITVTSGNFVIDSCDDSFHSNNSVHISGGDISATSGDDGIHADSSINIANGKIDLKKAYEGIESTDITVSGGEIHIVSNDDGFNGSGGNDGSASNGPGRDNFSAGNQLLTIEGGTVYVNSEGDGLDSNGSIKMTGGQVFVSGPTANNNGAVDYNGTFTQSGGLLIAAGSSGMAQAPSADSSQNAILMYYPSIQKGGTLVNLKDRSGKTIAAFTPEKDYQSVVISSADLKKNTTYTLYSGDTNVVDFTPTDTITYLCETGITTQRGFNPGGGGGGGGRGFGGNHNGGRPMAPPNSNTP